MAEGIWQVASMLLAAGAIYGGIKASMSRMIDDIKELKVDVETCNSRINRHLETHYPQQRN